MDESAAIRTFLLNCRAVDGAVLAVAWRTTYPPGNSLPDAETELSATGMPQSLSPREHQCWEVLSSGRLSLVPADGAWGHSGKPTEVPRKVAVIRKSRGQCDLGQR